jgi:hypothetical protein
MEKIKVMVGWDRNYSALLEVGAGFVVATGASLEDTKREFASSLEFQLDGMKETGEEIPVAFRGEYELEFELNSRALVHFADTLVSRSALAKASGINERQLGHYATGVSNPRPQQIARMKQGIRAIVTQLSALAL